MSKHWSQSDLILAIYLAIVAVVCAGCAGLFLVEEVW